MTGKKVTEKVADDIVKICVLIRQIVLETVKRCKQENRAVTSKGKIIILIEITQEIKFFLKKWFF